MKKRFFSQIYDVSAVCQWWSALWSRFEMRLDAQRIARRAADADGADAFRLRHQINLTIMAAATLLLVLSIEVFLGLAWLRHGRETYEPPGAA